MMAKEPRISQSAIQPMGVRLTWARSLGMGVAVLLVGLGFGGAAWLHARYDDTREQIVPLTTLSSAEYPEDPEDRSRGFAAHPHRSVLIQQTGNTKFRFALQPASPHATVIELLDVDLAHFVPAVPPWVKTDPDLIKVGLIDREWNRQQVSFERNSPHVRVHTGGDGFEQGRLSRVDLARNCLNAGLWELLLFTTEDGQDRLHEHVWFTFPLGLYKNLFEQVNGLSYWGYWWPLEHWVSPEGTPIRLDKLRTVEREWPLTANARWDEAPAWRGEQRLKRKNVPAPTTIRTYRDWYIQPVQFASFIQPGRYSVAHPRDTELHYLAEFTGAVLRRVRTPGSPQLLYELELTFRSSLTAQSTRLVFGGLQLRSLPAAIPDHYERGWQAPMGIANPSFLESYEEVLANSPVMRPFYGFHLDAQDRWIDHHAVGVDGPLLHWDAENPSTLHLYLISYERHALLNHFVLTIPPDAAR